MHRLFALRVVLPLLCGIGLIAILLTYADAEQVARAAHRFAFAYLPLLLLLTVGYQALRAAQWHLLLRTDGQLGTWRTAVMSYMGGELAKSLPGGQYLQTYLLRRAQGTPLAASVAATTVILWLETAVCLAILAALGVGTWAWVRPLAIVLLLGILMVALLVKGRVARREPETALRRARRLREAGLWLEHVTASAGSLLRPRAIGPAAALSTGYVAISALSLWVTAAALGVRGVGVEQALVVYAFALAANLLIVVPLDLGLTELSGLAVLSLFGVPRAEAVAVMLLHRALSGLLTGGVALVSLALLRRQVMAAVRGTHVARRDAAGTRCIEMPDSACGHNRVA